MDPQSNLSASFGITVAPGALQIFDLLSKEARWKNVNGNNWRPKFLWKSVGGDVNRGHTADGQLWVFGRTSEGDSAGDPWWVNFMPWREDGSEGQAFHDWKWEGRNMKGSGSDGCDMVSAANAEWIWRNILAAY